MCTEHILQADAGILASGTDNHLSIVHVQLCIKLQLVLREYIFTLYATVPGDDRLCLKIRLAWYDNLKDIFCIHRAATTRNDRRGTHPVNN